jgi:hypothetical protein
MEEEVLMPPGSFLEVVGVPRVVHLEDDKGSVLEIPMQISCPKTDTIEQTRAIRKTSLLSMVEHLFLEVRESLSLILFSLSPFFPLISHTYSNRTSRSFELSYLMFRTFARCYFIHFDFAYIMS